MKGPIVGARGPGTWLLVAAGIVIAATVAAAIAVMGSPAQQRLLRLDQRRVSDLQQLQEAVEAYHREHDRLPDAVATLSSQPGVALATVDPHMATPYGYRKLAEREYALCANFATDTAKAGRGRDGRAPAWIARDWAHATGQACFKRKIPDEVKGGQAAAIVGP